MAFFDRAASAVLFILLSYVCLVNAVNPRPYPPADAYLRTTNFLNRESYLSGLDDHQWYLDNIPFIDVPDKSIQDVYYYRASVIKRHIKWTHEGQGWITTEFIQPVSWASKFQTIPDSAAHQMVELRWLRDLNYVKNMIQAYTRAGVEKQSGITYTRYIEVGMLEHAQVTGDKEFLISQLEGMITGYWLWNVTRDNTTGLYHRNPLQDAQEYSLPGFLVGGPGGGPMQEWNDFGLSASMGGGNDYSLIWSGPETYRPSMNAYMIGGAWAISEVASLAGQDSVAQAWKEYGNDLYDRMQDQLYSQELDFWIDVVQGTNQRCQGRELIAYFPYRFNVGTDQKYIDDLAAALTAEHFLTDFGPTTLEQTNPYYTALKNTTYCCLWQGQSWPFSTCVYLDTLASIARDGSNDVITPEFFLQEFKKYTATNYKAGVPFTAEAHYPTINQWSADTTNHSEHYLHSTYLDNVFTNLFGIVPTLENKLVLRPLIPQNWTYFAVESIPYHGTLLSLVWDKYGSHYRNSSVGLSIYSNGTLFHHQRTLGAVNVTLPFDTAKAAETLASQPQWQNIATNINAPYNLPNVTASYVFNPQGDNAPWAPFKLHDGLLWYDITPDNFWTSNQSTLPYNTINITLPRARRMHGISLAILGNTQDGLEQGGVLACPDGIRVADAKGKTVAFKDPWDDCVPNALNTVPFANPSQSAANRSTPDSDYTVETDLLQVTLSDKLRYTTAVSEIQIWVEPNTGPRYEAEDGLIGTFIGSFEGRPTGLNGTVENGGVSLGDGGWVELAGVQRSDASAGKTSMTVIGGGHGNAIVQLNWLSNHTVTFSGTANKTVAVDMLAGGNVVTIFQKSGSPFIDAIVLNS